MGGGVLINPPLLLAGEVSLPDAQGGRPPHLGRQPQYVQADGACDGQEVQAGDLGGDGAADVAQRGGQVYSTQIGTEYIKYIFLLHFSKNFIINITHL